MIRKPVAFSKQTFTATALMATALWLAACSTAPTTQPAATIAPAGTSTATTTAAASPTVEASTVVTQSTSAESAPASAAIVKLNLNTATNEEFLTIPDVGDRMVREFNEYRPYISIQQFRQEIGKYVDDAQVAAYEEYLFVPVVPNTADSETLQQLPGVTPEIADALIAARPYASNATFLEALATHVTPEELAIGESYLESE